MLAVLAILGPATVRHLDRGGPPSHDEALARMSSTMIAVEGDRTEAHVAGLDIQATECPNACVVSASVRGHEAVEVARGDAIGSGIVHRMGDHRIVTVPGTHREVAFELPSPGKVDLYVHDVAADFGPPQTVLFLGWLALIAVGASTAVGSQQGRVWRRLGAKGPLQLAELPGVVALRMTHVAVLAWVAVPLIACVRTGLVG